MIRFFLQLFTILLFFLISVLSPAQSISGKIFNGGKSVPYAEVIVVKDKLIETTLSDEKGFYKIDLSENGDYLIEIMINGEKIYHNNINISGDIKENINIILDRESNIKEVVLTGKKKLVERKIDRLVFNLENSIAAQGGDGLDALKMTPNLSVRNDQITMIGKSGMSVMVNNRLLKLSGDDLISYLKTLKSEDIKSIEVITNPPAKYDAEGNSGIVNINLKKAKQNNWNASIGTFLRQSKYTQEGQSANITYNKNGFSSYGSVSHNDGVYYYRTEESNIWYTDKFYNSFSKMKYDFGSNVNANVGIDYDFSKNFSLGIQYLGNKSNITANEQNDTKIYSQENYLLQTISDSKRKRNNNSLNFHSTYKIDSLGSNITFNADYFDYNTDNVRTFATQQYNNFSDYISENDYSAQNGSNQKIKNYAAQIDVEHKLKIIAFSYGAKISQTKNSSNISFYNLTSGEPVLEPDKSDTFDYTENIYAGYISANKKFGEQWETKAGLRLEDTQTDGYSHNLNQTNKNHYTKLFPTLYILYKPNEIHSINLNYGKRINRPGYYVLNPFVRYINEFTTSEGNPFLRPYLTDNLELTYNYKNKWTNTLYLSNSKNIYDQVNYISNDNINSTTKYENFYKQLSFGLTENYTFEPLRNWESTVTANVYYKKIESSLPQTIRSFKGWSAFFETENNFTLNKGKNLSLSLDYWYQLPEYDAIYNKKALSSLDLGFKAMFLNKSLVLSVYASDIFRTLKIKNSSSFNLIVNSFQNYEDRQSFRLSVRYTIAKTSFRNKSIKTSNEEEKRRAN